MDWFTWLSKTNLDPSLVYEYALNFTHNELGDDDIAYFNHEFLQSMGISIAKHRLEILKLAREKKKSAKRAISPILWFKFALNQTRNYLAKQIRTMVHHHNHHRENTPLSLVPKRNHSLRWKVAMLQRNKRVIRVPLANPEWPKLKNDHSPRFEYGGNKIMMLTNGSPTHGESRSFESSQSSNWAESEAEAEAEYADNHWNSSFSRTTVGENWSSCTDEIKWDSMFQNLKPT